jgi:hypothetical protein
MIPMPDPVDSRSSPSPSLPRFPPTVRTAGIVWIVLGSGILINGIVLLVRQLGAGLDADSGSAEAALFGAVVGQLFQGVIGAVFLYEGIECCRGTIPSTVGIAVGSILFALIYVGIALFYAEARQGYRVALVFIPAVGLFVAGVLAFAGRTQYDAWWQVRRREREKGRCDTI